MNKSDLLVKLVAAGVVDSELSGRLDAMASETSITVPGPFPTITIDRKGDDYTLTGTPTAPPVIIAKPVIVPPVAPLVIDPNSHRDPA